MMKYKGIKLLSGFIVLVMLMCSISNLGQMGSRDTITDSILEQRIEGEPVMVNAPSISKKITTLNKTKTSDDVAISNKSVSSEEITTSKENVSIEKTINSKENVTSEATITLKETIALDKASMPIDVTTPEELATLEKSETSEKNELKLVLTAPEKAMVDVPF